MIPTGLAVPTLVALSAIAAAIVIHAFYDLFSGRKRHPDRRD